MEIMGEKHTTTYPTLLVVSSQARSLPACVCSSQSIQINFARAMSRDIIIMTPYLYGPKAHTQRSMNFV